tara:strand:- start:83056 stop:83652 length:597 start_codon:yes stop_codon:yes gene_type:complete
MNHFYGETGEYVSDQLEDWLNQLAHAATKDGREYAYVQAMAELGLRKNVALVDFCGLRCYTVDMTPEELKHLENLPEGHHAKDVVKCVLDCFGIDTVDGAWVARTIEFHVGEDADKLLVSKGLNRSCLICESVMHEIVEWSNVLDSVARGEWAKDVVAGKTEFSLVNWFSKQPKSPLLALAKQIANDNKACRDTQGNV